MPMMVGWNNDICLGMSVWLKGMYLKKVIVLDEEFKERNINLESWVEQPYGALPLPVPFVHGAKGTMYFDLSWLENMNQIDLASALDKEYQKLPPSPNGYVTKVTARARHFPGWIANIRSTWEKFRVVAKIKFPDLRIDAVGARTEDGTTFAPRVHITSHMIVRQYRGLSRNERRDKGPLKDRVVTLDVPEILRTDPKDWPDYLEKLVFEFKLNVTGQEVNIWH